MSMAMAVAGVALRTPRVWTVASLSKNASDAPSLSGPIPLAPPCMCAHWFVLSCCLFVYMRSLDFKMPFSLAGRTGRYSHFESQQRNRVQQQSLEHVSIRPTPCSLLSVACLLGGGREGSCSHYPLLRQANARQRCAHARYMHTRPSRPPPHTHTHTHPTHLSPKINRNNPRPTHTQKNGMH